MKAVFLDRDNTLIRNNGDLGDPRDVALRPGVGRALRELRERGYRLVVVTNQGGVARGKFSERDVDAVNQRIAELVDEEAGARAVIDRFYYCPYHPEGTVPEYRREHPWRKPKPGMLLQAARDLNLELSQCWMIGDQARDIEAGNAAGCRTVLLTNDRDSALSVAATLKATTLADAARHILHHQPAARRRSAANPQPVRSHSAGRTVVLATRPRSNRRKVEPPVSESPGPASELSRTNDVASDDESAARHDLHYLRRAMRDLAEEIRMERLGRHEYTPLRMAAGLCQLGVILAGLVAILRIGTFESFMIWMAGALLLQLATIALLLFDSRR